MDTTLSDPLVDRLIDGRYAVEARIARGGMAGVYLATDVRLERRVAVKVMHPALAEDPDFVARFNREARAAARLAHPDVVARASTTAWSSSSWSTCPARPCESS